MRFTTKTEYGLVCLVYMAKHQAEFHPVTIREMVQDEKFSLSFTEKILQRLRAAGIVSSQKGSQGGYVLAKKPTEITLKEIIEALEGHTFEVFCEPDFRKEIVCTHYSMCEIKPVWQKTKDLLDNFFESLTLDMLARNDIKSVIPERILKRA